METLISVKTLNKTEQQLLKALGFTVYFIGAVDGFNMFEIWTVR